jgi:hypothetical protein
VWTPAASNYVVQLLTTGCETTRGPCATRGPELVRLPILKVYMERTSGTKSILQLGSRNILHSKIYVGTTVISTSILEEIEDR